MVSRDDFDLENILNLAPEPTSQPAAPPPALADEVELGWLDGFEFFVHGGMEHLQALIILSITIAGGTRLSTLANGVLAFTLYAIAFLGGWVELVIVVVKPGQCPHHI